jgi:hypothetical protein
MKSVRFPKVLFLGLIFVLTACQAPGQSPGERIFKPGDVIDGMSLTKGAKDAAPLWTFCSSPQSVGNTTTSDCSVPLISRLAIGHIIMPGDDTLAMLDWSKISWELTIDGQPVDLQSFGTYDFVLPAMSHDPAPVREVFVRFTAWDVVLTNLNPGQHSLQGTARMGNESYIWVVQLSIEATGTPWAGPEIQPNV